MHQKRSCAKFSWYSWDNIEQVKSQCSVVGMAPDNIASEKVQFHVVLILLGQHSTGQKSMQCCPRYFRQHCIRKNPVQSCLSTLGQLHRSKPYLMLPKRLQTTLHRKNVVLLHIEHYCTGKTLCNVVPEAQNNIAQEKI